MLRKICVGYRHSGTAVFRFFVLSVLNRVCTCSMSWKGSHMLPATLSTVSSPSWRGRGRWTSSIVTPFSHRHLSRWDSGVVLKLQRVKQSWTCVQYCHASLTQTSQLMKQQWSFEVTKGKIDGRPVLSHVFDANISADEIVVEFWSHKRARQMNVQYCHAFLTQDVRGCLILLHLTDTNIYYCYTLLTEMSSITDTNKWSCYTFPTQISSIVTPYWYRYLVLLHLTNTEMLYCYTIPTQISSIVTCYWLRYLVLLTQISSIVTHTSTDI